MGLGKFKVFDDLPEVFEEIREYHRKQMPSGLSQIVKIKDDLIDAIRGAFMMARYAEPKYLIGRLPEDMPDLYHRETNAMGY
jgi:hypothetical protein